MGDVLGLGVAWLAAYALKFKIPHITQWLFQAMIGTVYHHAQIEPYVQSLWVMITLGVLSLLVCQAYRAHVGVFPLLDEWLRVVAAVSLTMVLLVTIHFFVPIIPESRTVLVYFWGVALVILISMRTMMMMGLSWWYAKGGGLARSAIVGTAMVSQDMAERMIMSPAMGYAYVGFIDDAPPDTIHPPLRESFRLLGSLESFVAICRDHRIDAVFVTRRDIEQSRLRDMMAHATEHGIELNILSDPMLHTPFVSAKVFDGVPMLSMSSRPNQWVQRCLKRAMDMVVSALGLLVLLPILVGIMGWIRWASPGASVWYCQDRVGYEGRVFSMVKFRSMVPDAETNTGPVMVNESGDHRYIRGGQWLRQFSLDELPQLWNVFRGDMSLVGPRPERPFFVAEFSKRIPFFNARHLVPVGITGWAQINGRSILTRQPEYKIKYDMYYINRWSLLLDIKILLKTIGVVFSREEAY